MACRGFLECILKLLNLLVTLVGLAMVGYAIYLFVVYEQSSSLDLSNIMLAGNEKGMLQLGRPLLMSVVVSSSFWDDLPRAWFILVFAGVGVVLFIISCFGCIGASTRNGFCLSCYAVLVVLLILIELGCAAFIYFDHSWESEIPTDTTGDFDKIFAFLEENWSIVKWVALGIVVLEALLLLLALVVRATTKPQEYDSDDEFIVARQSVQQPLINRPAPPATGVPVAVTLDQRPSRNDTWSARMREKYGLDTSEFTYNPSEVGRFQQTAVQPAEERSRCTIL
ncbi:Tobamovirus multiplication protein 2A [Dionaea muscipula]